jgi:predicted Zn-dependent protease
MKTTYRFYAISLTVLTCLTLASCATSPLGRSQLKLFPSDSLVKMGIDSFDGMKKETPLSTNKKHINLTQCVANAITKHVSKDVFSGTWEIQVFESEQVNAFALPGGKIGVYAGLLKVAKTPAQLAAVIGHEVGHVIAEHGNERMSASMMTQYGMTFTSEILRSQGVENSAQWMQIASMGSQVLLVLPYGRSHESEADLIGLDLMAKAGFEPEASVHLWQNMAKASGERPLELLSTHPAPETRIDQLTKRMPLANEFYSKSSKANCI